MTLQHLLEAARTKPDQIEVQVSHTYEVRGTKISRATAESIERATNSAFEKVLGSGGKTAEGGIVEREAAQQLATEFKNAIGIFLEAAEDSDDTAYLRDLIIKNVVPELAKRMLIERDPASILNDLNAGLIWDVDAGRHELKSDEIRSIKNAFESSDKFAEEWDRTYEVVRESAEKSATEEEFHRSMKESLDTGGGGGGWGFSAKMHLKTAWENLSDHEKKEVKEEWSNFKENRVDREKRMKEQWQKYTGEVYEAGTVPKKLKFDVVRKQDFSTATAVRATIVRPGARKPVAENYYYSLAPVAPGQLEIVRQLEAEMERTLTAYEQRIAATQSDITKLQFDRDLSIAYFNWTQQTIIGLCRVTGLQDGHGRMAAAFWEYINDVANLVPNGANRQFIRQMGWDETTETYRRQLAPADYEQAAKMGCANILGNTSPDRSEIERWMNLARERGTQQMRQEMKRVAGGVR